MNYRKVLSFTKSVFLKWRFVKYEKENGFTFVETLAVLAICAVFAIETEVSGVKIV